MVVSRKQLANYLGVSYSTAKRKYKLYMDIKTSKNQFLTSYDIASLDDLEHDFVLSRLKYHR